jgi:heme/copper-type cytochrome/quinol oxidase subunit 1
MQLRTLILQKQHDRTWIASLILVCLSILMHFGLAFILYILAKGDIRNPQKQMKLERYNKIALFIIVTVSIINVVINILMLTTNPKSFLDERSLELLQQKI